MTEISLPALEGTNPLGFLAALGVLDAVAATTPGATLRWTDDLVPHAVIGGQGRYFDQRILACHLLIRSDRRDRGRDTLDALAQACLERDHDYFADKRRSGCETQFHHDIPLRKYLCDGEFRRT